MGFTIPMLMSGYKPKTLNQSLTAIRELIKYIKELQLTIKYLKEINKYYENKINNENKK